MLSAIEPDVPELLVPGLFFIELLAHRVSAAAAEIELAVDLRYKRREIDVLFRGQAPDVIEVARLVAGTVGQRYNLLDRDLVESIDADRAVQGRSSYSS